MKIGILAQIKQKKITGINRVTVGTLTELQKIDKENEYYFLGNTEWLNIPLPAVDILFSSAQAIKLNLLQECHHFDVIHSHYRPFELSPHIRCGKILTIHDLIPYLHPEWNNKQFDYFDTAIRKCAVEADYVIAVSEATKKDIVDVYHIQPEKVKVIYNGLYPKQLFDSNDMGKTVDKLAGTDFLLSVSAIGANKNQTGMIEAFLLFKSRHKDDNSKLVITGPIRQFQVIRDVLEKYQELSDSVIFTGFVSDEELVWLYRNAKVFIYASFYEGFGLPVLEALSVGKAVITSDTSSLPEVGGEAAEYCDPYDVESIAASIEKVMLQDEYRRTLENRAKDQAAKFSYEKTAKQTLELYQSFR